MMTQTCLVGLTEEQKIKKIQKNIKEKIIKASGQFTNWGVTEEIRNKIVRLNANKKTKVVVKPDVSKRSYHTKEQCPKKMRPTFKQSR